MLPRTALEVALRDGWQMMGTPPCSRPQPEVLRRAILCFTFFTSERHLTLKNIRYLWVCGMAVRSDLSLVQALYSKRRVNAHRYLLAQWSRHFFLEGIGEAQEDASVSAMTPGPTHPNVEARQYRT